MGQFKGVKVTIIGVVLIMAGIWLTGQWIITQKEIAPGVSIPSVTSLAPYGWLLITIGAAVAILGIWMWTSPMLEFKAPAKPPKTRRQKITRAKPTSRFMTDLKFGAFLIVVGFLIRLLMVNVLHKKYGGEAGGDWVLILFVAIGILIIGFGVVEYAIARKKSSW